MPSKSHCPEGILLCIVIATIFMISACKADDQQETVQPAVALPVTLSPTSTALPAQAPPSPNSQNKTSIPKPVVNTPAQTDNSILDALLPDCYDKEFSPSQEWATGICVSDEIWIIRTDQTAKWTLSYERYYGSKFDDIGMGFIVPEYWTADGKYLYLSIQREVDGPVYFVNGWALLRLDLESGHLSETLKSQQSGYYSFSFFPDGSNLAYVYQYKEPLKLNIVNLQTGDTKRMPLSTQYDQAGEILWSPDKDKIALAQAKVDHEGNIPDLFAVTIIDLGSQSAQTIIKDNSLEIMPTQWLDNTKVELKDTDGKGWLFDTVANVLRKSIK